MPLPDIPPGLEARANQALATFIETLEGIQPDYLIQHGGYFQGLHAAIPADGADYVPDPDQHPTDQAESYADEGVTFPSNGPIALGIDVYDGPQGKGWIVYGLIIVAGQVWKKQADQGPMGLSFDWRELTDG